MTQRRAPARKPDLDPASAAELEQLLEYLKRSRGFDFTGYKRESLGRRISKRMQAVGVHRFAEYVDYLEVHPEEFAALFNTVLINVTRFFRDEGAWEYLAQEILPALIERAGPQAEIRVWSAGCASGEEPYTLAMLLAEAVGPDAFRERVKIYATDVDEDALAKARSAAYTAREVEGIPPALLEKYFDRVDGDWVFRKELRRQVIFGRHDLVQDAPISRVDLLVCRNTLMYFNAETQSRILGRFHFALGDNGILFLGRAETLLTHASTFVPIDLKRRISMKVPRAGLALRDRLLFAPPSGGEDAAGDAMEHLRLRELATDVTPVAQVVVDAAGTVVLVNERARALFGLSSGDVGRPLQDLKISYRPVELRSLLEQVYGERRPILVRDVQLAPAGAEPRWLELQLLPLIDGGMPVGASLSFIDVTTAKRLQLDLERANQELEASYEELQSTNEELETMNEELQSTNEELTTINDELRDRSDELNRANAFLDSIFASLRGGVIVVDAELRILVWNAGAYELWGLRQEEVLGRNILSLDIGLPVEQLKQPMRDILRGEPPADAVIELDATNRRGRAIRCRTTISQLLGPTGEARGLILMTES